MRCWTATRGDGACIAFAKCLDDQVHVFKQAPITENLPHCKKVTLPVEKGDLDDSMCPTCAAFAEEFGDGEQPLN